MMRANVAPRSFGSIGSVAAVALLLACGGDLAEVAGTPGGPGTVLEPGDSSPSVSLAFAAAVPAGAFEPLMVAALQETATLYVVADWKNVPAGAVERLDVVMPGGALYASLELPLAETERGDLRFEVLEDGTRRLTFLLPVWGTPIESYGITGTWSATATLVGGTATASASIELE